MPAFRADPGFLAVSYGRRGVPMSRLEQVVDVIHGDPASCSSSDHDFLATWGLPTKPIRRRCPWPVVARGWPTTTCRSSRRRRCCSNGASSWPTCSHRSGWSASTSQAPWPRPTPWGSRHLYHTSGGGWGGHLDLVQGVVAPGRIRNPQGGGRRAAAWVATRSANPPGTCCQAGCRVVDDAAPG